jgi:type IV pilus assembly protein PilV
MHSKQMGFSLLEVLISIFILAIGLLGLAALQTTSLKNNHSAQYRTTATVLTYDIIERMRLNQTADYTLTLAGAPSGATLKDLDLIDWIDSIAVELPQGDGAVAVNGDIVTVTVQWDDSRGTAGNNAQSFTVRTER